ncbi:MAG: lycopene cyclase domain-containing protein [Mucilaginibacter polytrichastri]|nr:lycopene cyclase domain-containing protein [Mucilaginibacter polytrichastri]
MKTAYLLINILTVFFPVVLSFDRRVHFYSKWKYIWPGLAISGVVFLAWDMVFTYADVWSFNPDYVLGLYFFGLPLEEILFFVTVPFACLFIYACLNHYVRWQMPVLVRKIISNALLSFLLLTLVFHYSRVYTLIAFGLLFALIVWAEFYKNVPWLGRFYIAFIVSLLPFYIVNGVLTSIPIVSYNNAQNLGIRVGTIPLEDHFYSMAMLLMNTAFFEFFQVKKARNGTA